jgi:hypothetical protein
MPKQQQQQNQKPERKLGLRDIPGKLCYKIVQNSASILNLQIQKVNLNSNLIFCNWITKCSSNVKKTCVLQQNIHVKEDVTPNPDANIEF